MVKRYQERKTEESNAAVDATSSGETEKKEDANKATEEPKEDTKQEESSDDDSSSSSEDESESIKEDEKKDDDDGDSNSDDSESSNEAKVEQSRIEEKKIDTPEVDTSAEDDGKVGKDHEIWNVLEKLNSKQKRTLSRKLDRLGKVALEEVEQEANEILDKTIPIEVEPKRERTEAASTDKNPSSETIEPKKKKRKKAADWSSLPPEERLRREDQRRKQQEAAERRARGESIKPGHKRPLNSARRRANRRKPKWASKTPSGAPDISDYKTDHHSSGFLHRKNHHRPQEQSMNNY
jgi:hypothetical protein